VVKDAPAISPQHKEASPTKPDPKKESPQQPVAPEPPLVLTYLGDACSESTFKSKSLIVGDGAVGKTYLLAALQDNIKAEDEGYEPTTFGSQDLQWEADREDDTKRLIEFALWDTAGQEGFTELRKLAYPGTKVYMLAYDCTSKISLANLHTKWIDEVKREIAEGGDPDIREGEEPWIVMVGCKMDKPGADATSGEEDEVAAKLNACALIRTSAVMPDTEASGVAKLKLVLSNLACMYEDQQPKPSWDDWKN